MMNGESKPYAEWTRADVESFVARLSRDASMEALRALPEQAERMRKVPGILFACGASGVRARIAGTGLEVWELISDYLAEGKDREAVAEIFDWLTPEQIGAAVAYFEAYPDEILDSIALEEAFARAFDRADL